MEYHQTQNSIDRKVWQAKVGVVHDSVYLMSNEGELAFKEPVGKKIEEEAWPGIGGEYVYFISTWWYWTV